MSKEYIGIIGTLLIIINVINIFIIALFAIWDTNAYWIANIEHIDGKLVFTSIMFIVLGFILGSIGFDEEIKY